MRAWKVALVALPLLLAGCGGGEAGNSGSQSSDRGSGGEVSEAAEQTTAGAAGEETTSIASRQETVTIEASGGESVEVRVEIADDSNEMAFGLMERTALAGDAGMLFVYPEERQLSFWMKNTLIPLSIAFMDSEGRIVDIQEMKALDDEPPHYTSAKPARYALEANKGFFEERGVEVGDRARLPV
jgi:uncharacterized membrane protein (UPF0127 family)